MCGGVGGGYHFNFLLCFSYLVYHVIHTEALSGHTAADCSHTLFASLFKHLFYCIPDLFSEYVDFKEKPWLVTKSRSTDVTS
jgi:hypothetical protein